jgi:hypothetical protein
VLDELDPVAAAVVVGTDAAEAEVRHTLRALGYAVGGNTPGAHATADDAAATLAAAAPATMPVGDVAPTDGGTGGAAGDADNTDDARADETAADGRGADESDDAYDASFHGDFDDADDDDDVDAPESALQRALTEGAVAAGAAGLGAVAPAAPSVITVVRGGTVPAHAALVVLYDLPSTRDTLDRVAAARAGQLVALVQPRQLDALRSLAGGPVRALPLGEAARRARARDEALRAELRGELERGLPPRELAVLEPLIAEHDPSEVAAAALRLLDRERARRAIVAAPGAPAAAAGASAAPAFPPSGMTRLFITVGSRDSVRPGDLVGAITGEAGISSDKLGKIDVRESFSLVEVQSAEAERVVAKVNGIAIRGRRVTVRPERDSGGGRGGPGGRSGQRAGRQAAARRRPRRPRGPAAQWAGARRLRRSPGSGRSR